MKPPDKSKPRRRRYTGFFLQRNRREIYTGLGLLKQLAGIGIRIAGFSVTSLTHRLLPEPVLATEACFFLIFELSSGGRFHG